uniref:DUF1618 domain-containing protein n=1 Tax=Leersia perrieri TaxID=77586 RepID=A0A0D9V5R3_9ORYZ
MTGDVAVLPPLVGKDRPRVYACTLLTGADLDDGPSEFFRVLIVYNRHRFTAFRSYSLDTSSWSVEAKKTSGPKLTNWDLRKLGQGVVLHGVAYWPLRRMALAVRLDTPEPTLVRMPPDGIVNSIQQLRLLGVTPDGKLCFIDAGYSTLWDCPAGCVSLGLVVFETTGDGGEWVRSKRRLGRFPQFKIECAAAIKLRWFCEKSHVLLFTISNGSNNPGTYALNLATKEIEKLATGTNRNSWRNFVGYEIGSAWYCNHIHQAKSDFLWMPIFCWVVCAVLSCPKKDLFRQPSPN